VMEAFLRNTEFQPILAASVAQAEVWTARHMPAAIVADIYLGDDTSWGFIARLRDKLPDLPLIATSAFDEGEASLARGADLFLSKPVNREELIGELRRLTSRSGTRRLLVVDDNEVSRYILRDILDQPWLEIREAANGKEAFRSIQESMPDAIVLDLLMPDMSGFEILRQLRASPATETLPVLIYTSKALNEAEKAQLESLHARIVRKEDVTTRLSAQPFLDWVRSVGLTPDIGVRHHDA